MLKAPKLTLGNATIMVFVLFVVCSAISGGLMGSATEIVFDQASVFRPGDQTENQTDTVKKTVTMYQAGMAFAAFATLFAFAFIVMLIVYLTRK